MTAAEAFVLKLANEALQGELRSARLLQDGLDSRADPSAGYSNDITAIVRVVVAPGSVNSALEPLRIGRKLDCYRKTARMVPEPWIVEKAIERLGDRRLSAEEQRTIVKATRTPEKVNWPEWWSLTKS